MLAIVGTVPDENFPLLTGQVRLENDIIHIENRKVKVNRGTPALLAAAVKAGEVFGRPPPIAFLVGDIGKGKGSRTLYEYLTLHLDNVDFRTITFHYLQPDVDWHNRVLFAIEKMRRRPFLIADAGFMYAAKMSGQSPAYDLFTPDAGEMAFLADEEAPHPFYTRGFILHEEDKLPELITRAYDHENAARYLLVKGKKDYIADQEGVKASVNAPLVEALEAMGGTGDTLTGIVSAIIDAGMDIVDAAKIAALTNRYAGYYAKPTPASQVIDIIKKIPAALEKVLEDGREGREMR